MRRFGTVFLTLGATTLIAALALAGKGDPAGDSIVFGHDFGSDPRLDDRAVDSGAALYRLDWQPDAPVFPGDSAGSLTALYDSSLPAGRFGFRLPGSFTEADGFSAGAAFVIRSAGFDADPNGFFQISWGLWNSVTTGLNRTGSLVSSADTFELIEFDYFPAVSPFFGGPFLAPSAFGSEVAGDSFANFTSLFDLEAQLPLDVPLLAVIETRPDVDALVLSVFRIVDSARVVPLNGAVGVAPLQFLALRDYEVDTIGLTLWNDGFGGASPALRATLDFHLLSVTSGRVDRPEDLLALGDAGDDEGADDESSDD